MSEQNGRQAKPSQMRVDSHGLYTLERKGVGYADDTHASPVFGRLQAQMCLEKMVFIPGIATHQRQGSFG
jgi:hypothetical protein